jgi:MFS transporter, OFA family, oxalate/formate antiporter
VAVAWTLNSVADALTTLYVAAAIGGIGAGAVYGTCVGNALRWFPDRRGLAAGLTAAGFGAGSALTIIPIQGMIQTSGYEATFLWFGLGHGLVVVALSFLLRAPSPGEAPPSIRLRQSSCDYTPLEALSSPIFWVMYVMFVLVGAGGLMVTAQLAPIAIDFQIAKTPVSLLGLTLPALTFALSIDRVLNGLTRPFFGWLSDHIGRENTMFMALGLRGCRYLGSRPIRPRPRSVRDLGRGCILRLARDLLSVPFDLHRCLRRQVRDHQCGFALHCEGHRLASGAARQRAGRGEP